MGKVLVALSFLGLLALSSGFRLKPSKGVKLSLTVGQCDGTECPAGCCPEKDWFCCDDNMHCAATEADCPFLASKLVKMAAKKQCPGVMCPAGCCPELYWYCCMDNLHCAENKGDCPPVASKLVKMAANMDPET